MGLKGRMRLCDLGETAIEYYEQALAIAREIGDRRGEGAGWATWAWPMPTWANSQGHRLLRAGTSHCPRDRGQKNEGEVLCNLGKAFLI